MLKAIDFEILRGMKANGLIRVPLERQPVHVATLLDEDAFNVGFYLVHRKTVFLEDRFHDWDWSDGTLRYYTRVADVADVLVVYKIDDVVPVARFDPMTGEPLS